MRRLPADMGQVERQVTDIVVRVLRARPLGKPECQQLLTFLVNKHSPELPADLYQTLDSMFIALKGYRQGMDQKEARRIPVDCCFGPPYSFIVEVDEVQHFTSYKATALNHYPEDASLGFDLQEYLQLCERYADEAYRKGPSGYRKPKPEFPFDGGRAAQRAFFDAFKDLLPARHGLRPTLRIPVLTSAVDGQDVERRIRRYLDANGLPVPQ